MPPSGKEQLMLKVLLPLSIILALAVAFLLGRESMWQRGQPTPSPAGTTAGPAPGPVVTVTSTPTSVGETAASLSGSGMPSTPVSAPEPVRVTSGGTPAGHRSAAAGRVAAYFSRVDSLMSVSTGSGSAQEVASQAISKAMQGDSSDLDQISAATQALERQLSLMTPTVPEACRTYHAGLLSQLRDSQTMLDGVADALRTNDVSKLSSLASLGKSSQEKTQQLQKEREAIVARYGL